MPQTELASANRFAFLGKLSASIAEINQPICAVVMNAETALKLLLAQPTDTEAMRRLLACIVKDEVRTGDIVNRTRALIKESAATEGMPGDQSENASVSISIKMRPSDPTRL
jgi:C4-dicarboxylate-specific signal transduction histidine kinase